MGRIRTVKPEFFLHEGLFDLEQETGLPIRIAFQGLWCQADREGRFHWRPRKLKAQICPYDELDFSRVLDALATRGFVVRYASNGGDFGYIPSFKSHQVINNRESDSIIPPPDASGSEVITCTRDPRVDYACPTPLEHAQGEGKGREQEGKGKEYNPHNPPSGESEGKKRKRTPKPRSKAFLEFWQAYPKRVGIDAACTAWTNAGAKIRLHRSCDAAEAVRIMLTAAQEFAKTTLGQHPRFCPNAATWLNQGRYDDDRAAWNRPPDDERPRNLGGKDYSLDDFLSKPDDAA